MKKISSLVLVIVLMCAFFSCVEKKKTDEPQNTTTSNTPLKIVCTTGMISDIVQNIVGDKAEVIALMGAGVDPHLYKATQNDVALLSNADIIFYNGLHLEGKMSEILEKMSSKRSVVPLSNVLPKESLRQVAQGTHDPHIWMNVDYWRQTLPLIVQTVAQKRPQLKSFLEQNLETYSKELEELHQEVLAQMEQIPQGQRVLITSHDAFYYFGRAYHIEVKPLQGISTASEAGISDINELVKFIVDRKIKAVFVESSISPQAINAVMEGARQKGADVKLGATLYSDAMGEKGTSEGNYLGMMKYNAIKIKENLK